MMSLHHRWCIAAAAAIVAAAPPASTQQRNDPGFRFVNANPAFAREKGPRICVDEAHQNVHTVGGLFAPFAEILRTDGFRVTRFTESLSAKTLTACDVLILGSGRSTSPAPPDHWAYPHSSAYERTEIDALLVWIRSGGGLMLVWDHAPAAGAAAGLASLLGVQTLDAWADATPRGMYPEVMRRPDWLQGDHPVLRGRSSIEQVDSLATHGAGAFFPSRSIRAMVRYGRDATAWVRLGDMGQGISVIPEAEWPRFDIEGWLLAGTREFGQGRVVFLGDATLCTAQLYGPEAVPLAMSHPSGWQNARFCVNTVRWLVGVLQ